VHKDGDHLWVPKEVDEIVKVGFQEPAKNASDDHK